MWKLWLPLLVTFYLCECVFSEIPPDQTCKTSSHRTIKLSVQSRMNKSSEWKDTFAAFAESSHSSGVTDVDLTHTVIECDSKRSIFIQGVAIVNSGPGAQLIRNSSLKYPAQPTTVTRTDELYFHQRCGKNVDILGDGRLARKIRKEDDRNSQLFTHRPLKNDEIFEVKLEEKSSQFSSLARIGIGILTVSPDAVEILPAMYKSPVAIMHYNKNVFSGHRLVFQNYGQDKDYLKVGERLGVMRNKHGTIHFFINGEDQGPAAWNIPSPVYGVVELWWSAAKVSIIDTSSYRGISAS